MKRNSFKVFITVLAVTSFMLFNTCTIAATPSINLTQTPEVTRIWGADRYETAKAIAEKYSSDTVENIVLVPGNSYANAIPAAVLAYQKKAAFLLVGPSANQTKEAFDFIAKHLNTAGMVYLVGDRDQIGKDFESKLADIGCANITRISGENKIETDHLIAKELSVQIGTPVVIATSENFPDSLSISSIAAANGWPILFSENNQLPDSIKEYISSIKPSQFYITGGTVVVSAEVEAELKLIQPEAEFIRFAGKDRYDTSRQIANYFAPDASNIYLASGLQFPDGITGGMLAAQTKAPVLLINPNAQIQELSNFRTVSTITCFGGTQALSAELVRGLRQKSSVVNPYVVYSYEQMRKDAAKIQELYPEAVQLETIGQSVENRELLLLKLGKGEKKVFLNGSMHAREYMTTSFLMKLIDEYAYAYTYDEAFDNYNVKTLLDNVTLYIVPMVNPDGVNLVQNGLSAVNNPQKVKQMRLFYPKLGYASWKANINGVDLNRNFPVGWDVKSSDTKVPSSQNYKGTQPMTEPEVMAVMDLVKNNSFKIVVSYHTQGEYIFWSDKNCGSFNYLLEPMTNRLVSLTGYEKGGKIHTSGNWGAGIADWTRSLKIPTFTLELCPYRSEIPYPDSGFDDVWERVKDTGLFFAQEAIAFDGGITK
ncbi:cell wall-binding repeat-containing protein [Desulfosporosinus sp.]|uniref:cell wall-binding repeat-containing protein n=1 Tax=Desulfosporosinus sp. TaxID=157907 RepID=UPI0025C0EBC3|nr:cell wall-binding repeat-containing protein [Desulfosporosinus sp.]MBC2727049.1 cell wall-binding repeat-containing protein [Desulfosporosinus sp.]